MIELTDDIKMDYKIPYHVQAIEQNDEFMLPISHEVELFGKLLVVY